MDKNRGAVQRVLSSIVDEYNCIVLDQLGLIWDAVSERQQAVKLSKEAAEKRGNKLNNDMMRV